MKRKNKFQLSLVAFLVSMLMLLQNVNAQAELLIRCDDTGMSHTVNLAAKKLIETGIPFSTSVMFVCPWYQEAVELLKSEPHVSVGIHLTLNSEWKNYKWGPILGNEVSSLTDENGYFYSSEEEFKNCGYDLAEVEKELRAQIERGINSGLQIDYIDQHMGTAASTPKLRALVRKLAGEYKLGISHYFNENYFSVWDVNPEKKLNKIIETMSHLKKDQPNLIVIHLGLETEEMEALVDMNNPVDPYRVSKHRSAELNALCSKAFEKAVKENKIKLTNYRMIIKKHGLATMASPAEGMPGYEGDKKNVAK